MSGWSDPYGGGDDFTFMGDYDAGSLGSHIQMAGEVIEQSISLNSVQSPLPPAPVVQGVGSNNNHASFQSPDHYNESMAGSSMPPLSCGWVDAYISDDSFTNMDGSDSNYQAFYDGDAQLQIAGDVVSRGVLYDSYLGINTTTCFYTPFGNMNSPWTYTIELPYLGACPPFAIIPYPDLL